MNRFTITYKDVLEEKIIFDIITGQKKTIFVPLSIPLWMKVSKKKILLYSQDPYFREGYKIFESILGSQLNIFCKKHTYILIRPDAVVARKVDLIINELKKINFEPIYSRTLKINRHMSRAIWFYHLNAAPTERFSIIDFFFQDKECLFVIFKNDKCTNASLELSRIKGSVDIKKRNNNHLRSKICAESNLLSFIHTPDDSCDVIREMMIFFTTRLIKNIFNSMNSNNKQDINLIIQKLYKNTKRKDLSIKTVFQKVKRELFFLSDYYQTEKNFIINELSKSLSVDYKNKKNFLNNLFQLPLNLDNWDKIILLSHFSQEDLLNVKYLDY